MEMCYGGALVMPNSFAVMDEDEMMYVEGGMSKRDMALNLLLGVVAGIIGNKLSKYCTLANLKAALAFCAKAAKVVWVAISNAISWIWNTPVALACVTVAAGTTVGIMVAWCRYKKKR